METQSPPQKGGGPPKIFGPCLLWPNGWMDQDAAWHEGRPQPRRLCVRWGFSPPSHKGDGASSPIFSPFQLWPNGWMHQNVTWYGGWPPLRGLCVRWGPSPLPNKGRSPPIFGPHLLWPNGCMDQDALGTEVGFGLCEIVLDEDQATPPLKGHGPPPVFGKCRLWPKG